MEGHHDAGIPFREHSMLSNPRAPPDLVNSSLEIAICKVCTIPVHHCTQAWKAQYHTSVYVNKQIGFNRDGQAREVRRSVESLSLG